MPEGPDRKPAPTPGPPDRAPAAASALTTLPNAITFVRLCAVPATVWLIIQGRFDLAFLLFLGAGLSDALDGWLARVLDARSSLGAVLDPVADKALLVSSYVALAATGVLPDWLAILVVFRDVLIVGGVVMLRMMGMPPRISPSRLSKANTALQILLVAVALLLRGWPGLLPGAFPLALLAVLVPLVAASTLLSGGAYVLAAARGEGRA
ncbi:CDP-diacylglycerol--glycerol-3-phosphate 3-phosphatidyltransferase [Roseomonas mucosa]|uniref:CDP-diacylglycerol--glycerol-3-phosphate 3-phosphatidyltransferase n=1 Tax=Roseomonas mucosa TaxID=207340 RepID=A0A4Y1MWP8_9PROT|nr:CDP-alcohol phosphatidyltransferase family protein [Roseomonas mucosa]AWV22341.1 CDP-diacylglycerol--glycerol-3-phosphate 3-phosphatidyltransferase [Roseomonas mucosa]MDT8276059.1 CDP-alcohol phosphatidyltransferase family protein [Roseomonas mucosa]MDT8352931.1 CDP-alcohol phosphatidyltransferase family protein [Roseomonas mucosa]